MANHTYRSDLPVTALRYAAGELSPGETAAFEAQLATEQTAREALAEAIRLSAAALDRPAPAPDPLVREAVRDALRPSLVSWLFPRRRYRGHPLAWAGLGGAVAAGLTALGVWLGDQPPERTRPAIVDLEPVQKPELGVPAVLKIPDGPKSITGDNLSAIPESPDDSTDSANEDEMPMSEVLPDPDEKREPAAPLAPLAPPAEGKPILQTDPLTR